MTSQFSGEMIKYIPKRRKNGEVLLFESSEDKRQGTDWEKVSILHMSARGLVSRIYEELFTAQ